MKSQKEKNTKKDTDIAVGIPLGLSVGLSLGVLFGILTDNIGFGMMIGGSLRRFGCRCVEKQKEKGAGKKR